MALCGDGSYMFSVPSAVHWIARKYRTPFLQVIYNNRGWKSPKLSTLAVHPDGYASRANEIGVSFDPPPDYAGIAAAAGGAFARRVRHAPTSSKMPSRRRSPWSATSGVVPSSTCGCRISRVCDRAGSRAKWRCARREIAAKTCP